MFIRVYDSSFLLFKEVMFMEFLTQLDGVLHTFYMGTARPLMEVIVQLIPCFGLFCYLYVMKMLSIAISFEENKINDVLNKLKGTQDYDNARVALSLICMYSKGLLVSTKGKNVCCVSVKLNDEELIKIPSPIFIKYSLLSHTDLANKITNEEDLANILPDGFGVEFLDECADYSIYGMFLSNFWKGMFVLSTLCCSHAAAISFGNFAMLPIYAIILFFFFKIGKEYRFTNCSEQLYVNRYVCTDYFNELVSTIDKVSDAVKTLALVKEPLIRYIGSAYVYRDDVLLCELPLRCLESGLPMSGEVEIVGEYMNSSKKILEELDKMDLKYPSGFSVNFSALQGN